MTAALAGTYNNLIAIGAVSGTIGAGTATNPVGAPATLQVRNPVTITKAFSPSTVSPGTPSTVTITLSNSNVVALTSAVLADNLPTNLTVALVPTASTTCGGTVTAAPSATSVVLTGATIPASGSCVLVFNAVSNVSGSYLNTIPAGNLATSQGVTNENPASDTLKVLDPPTVNKQFSPTSIPASGTSTLSIVLGNTNTSAATLTGALVDTLPTSPGNIVVAAPNGLSGTCTLGSVTATAGAGTVTYASGASIPAGGCTINVNVTGTVVGNYNNFIPAGALTTNLGNNVQTASANLAISPLGFISGRVFKDNNLTPNGIYDGSDTPIANVTINLTGTDYGADAAPGGGDDVAISQSTTTDALGNYSFIGLNAGSYTVTEPTQPTGTQNGITTAAAVSGGGGGTIGTATAIGVTPSAVSNIILLKNIANAVANSAGNNFAEIVPSSISGTVFLDQNDNGVQNAADTALAGVTLELLNGANTVITTTTTDASGNYTFSGLAPGTYSVREPTQPVNTANGKTIAGAIGNGGTAGTPTAQGVVPSKIGTIILPPNTTTTGNNFAEVPAGRQVSGRVFIDTNNDGIFNGSDSGVGSYTLNLTGTDFNGLPVSASVATTADGRYVFAGLAEGTYTVTEPSQPANSNNGITTAGSTGGVATSTSVTPSVIASINLTGFNTISSDNNFAETPLLTGAIFGHVYVDNNKNGVIDTGETGIGGVTLKLTGIDDNGATINLTTTSAADGTYIFDGIEPSNAAGYTVTEIQPAAYGDGLTTVAAPNPGHPAAVKPVAPGGQDTISGIVLTIGAKLPNYNFGEQAANNSIAGYVYVDANDNGVKEAGESGIAGVAVTLTGTDNKGNAVTLATATGADGSYSFANLQPSNAAGYTITETQPAAYADGKTTIAAGNPGLANAAKPVAASGADTITKVVLLTGSSLVDYDFGEHAANNSIAGYVYLDANKNGVKDTGETGIAGVVVNLTGTDTLGAPVSLTTTTAADGHYIFTSLQSSAAAGYTITEIQPTGYIDGKTTIVGGGPGAATSGKPVGVDNTDIITAVKLNPGDNLTGYLFGENNIPFLKPPIVNGYVWLDRDHSRVRPTDGSQLGQPGWTVELRQNGTLICTTTTDATGFYQFDNLHCPGYEDTGLPTGSGFSIVFSKNGNNLPNVPVSGGNKGLVPPTGGQITNITLSAAEAVTEQNLPLDPAGVVYDSVTRKPVAGAVVTISGPAGFDPATQLVGGLPGLTQTVGTDGLYQFLLQNAFPSGVYTLTVTAPAGYLPAPSTSLPVCAGPVHVGSVPTPALVQASDFAPGLAVTPQLNPATCVGLVPGGAATTQYYFSFTITNGGSAPILNNHIPLDPILSGTILVTKTTPKVNVARSDLVPYTITATNLQTTAQNNVAVRDQIPPGFKYRTGSSRVNGIAAEPAVSGRLLDWGTMNFAPQEKKTFTLILVVGTGVGDGLYTNQAWAASSLTNAQVSNMALATVRIVPDPTFDCPDIIGKVFDDRNANGYQDPGEPGIPGVRLATPRGLLVTTDAEGRFHVPCPDIPNPDRGSNFVMKLDDRTLPSGYRLTTENPRDVRITRGKVTKLNFGATIHRVVRLELADAAFAPGSEKLLPVWMEKIAALPEQLKGKPSVLRIAYQRGTEAQELVNKRIAEIGDDIRKRWESLKGEYTLVIETEGAQ